MCGRYVIVSEVVSIEKQFNISIEANFKIQPSYNVSPGQMAPVILNHNPRKLELARFGYTPSWSDQSRMSINARVDSSEDNPTDDSQYFAKGGKPSIFQHRFWRGAIRNKRCIIIADAFYEGPKKERLSKPYLVYMRNKQRPFAMAGVWDEYEANDGSQQIGFAILTVPPNDLMNQIGHHRSPVILPPSKINQYLTGELSDIGNLLTPYPAKYMNAYPVDAKMKSWKENGKDLVQPIGNPIYQEHDQFMQEKLNLQGMGDHKRKKREKDPFKPKWGKSVDED